MQFEQLGPYRIGKQLGRGGMGTVYAAVDSTLGTSAAVKVLAPQLAFQVGFRDRFAAEIESLKKLHHPNIVQLFGYGEQNEVLFYAMELVEGISLEDELIRGRRFEWREVCQIGIQLCRALKLAHDHGVIHRDIKPANLLLTPNGDVKLTDFGIARLFGNTGLTSEGGVLGTAEYMAPEQAEGKRVTHHCDMYSLGGVMYALLAGRPPFRSDSLLEMLQMQRYSTPEPVRRFAPDTPVEFEEIIAQLLAKEPQQRVPNALMLSRRLEAMQRGLTVRTHVPEPEPPAEDDTLGDDDDFKLEPDPKQKSPAKPRSVPLKATIDGEVGGLQVRATQAGGDPSLVSDTSDLGSGGAPAVALSLVGANVAASTPLPAAPARFTTVEEEEQRERARRESERERFISPATLMLIASLLAIAGIVWYALQPPSANALYKKIDAAAQTNNPRRLIEARDDVAQFLQLYPNDQRAPTVHEYQERIEAAEQQGGNQLVQARLLVERYPNSPLAPEYLEAVRLAELDPSRALVRLNALVNMYDDAGQQPPAIREFVNAAQRQRPALERRVAAMTASRRAIIEERLKRADEVSRHHPEEARLIRQAIVELYKDEPWAAAQVERARAALAAGPLSVPGR